MHIFRYIILLALSTLVLSAEEWRLPAIISDDMILQENEEVRLWGWTEPSRKVVVDLLLVDGVKVSSQCTSEADGSFLIKLNTMGQIGKKGVITFTQDGEVRQKVSNVLVGDVWLASGQSNMAFPLSKSSSYKDEISKANIAEIRFFYVPRGNAASLQRDFSFLAPIKPQWVICSPERAGSFSAVAYHFAKSLNESRDIPVGIISCSWGGSMVEAWLCRESFASDARLDTFLTTWDKGYAEYKDENQQKLESLESEVAKARESGKEHPVNLRGLAFDYTPQHRPTQLYNAMYAPISRASIRGVIWYQGESNCRSMEQIPSYEPSFEALVNQYRRDQADEELPILWVNLAGFEPSAKHSKTWPAFREVQTRLTSLPFCAQAMALDIGAKKDVHPKNKKIVGERLALAARAIAYSEDIVFRGPQLKDVRFDGDQAILSFTGGKLEVKDQPFFELAAEDKKFLPAKIVTSSATNVTIACEQIKHPRYVRYNWRGMPRGHLYNQAGLPASSFRTTGQEVEAK